MEMAVVRRTGILRAFNVTLLYIASKLMIFPTLVAYVLLGNELTPEKVISKFTNLNWKKPIQTWKFIGISYRRSFQ